MTSSQRAHHARPELTQGLDRHSPSTVTQETDRFVLSVDTRPIAASAAESVGAAVNGPSHEARADVSAAPINPAPTLSFSFPLLGPIALQADAAPVITQAQVDQLLAGLSQSLAKIEGQVLTEVFADTLPLLGAHLADAAAAGNPALHFVATLQDALTGDGHGLGALKGGGTYTEAQVVQALNAGFASLGINAGATFSLADPANVKLVMSASKAYAGFDTAMDDGLALPGIALHADGTAHTAMSYMFNLAAGLDGSGFYLDTDSYSSLSATFDTTLSGLAPEAELGPLRYRITDESATDSDGIAPTRFNGAFLMDVLDPGTQGADGKLRLGELGADVMDATLRGTANVNLNLISDLGTAVLPDIATDLRLNWSFGSAKLDPSASYANFGDAPTLSFNNVSLGLGSFFSDFVSPVFDAVQTLTAPLQPIVDVLQTEIGFLSDLAGKKMTLLDVAGFSGAMDPETQARLDLYVDLIDFINSVPDGGDVRIDLGDFRLDGQDARSGAFQLGNAVPQSIRNALAPAAQDAGLADFLQSKDDLPGGGLAFPIIENPQTAINLLLGKPVDFFTYNVPGLDIEDLGFDSFYRIFGPFGVRLTAEVEAHAYLDIGYDSSGLVQFAQSGDAEDIFNGFYVVDQEGAEGELTASLEAFAAANLVFAEFGVGGGINGNLSAELNDTDSTPGDGRIHLAELDDSCLFDLSGELSAGLSAYLTVGIGPFSETFEKDLGSEVLLSFDATGCDVDGTPGVPVLAHKVGASLALHVGDDTALRRIGSLEDATDDFVVVHRAGAAGNETVAVIGNGLVTEAGTKVDPQDHTVGANGRITANGGVLDDTLVLAADVLSPATMRGAEGSDRVIGGAGDDQLFGDAGTDLLRGGAGNDTLNGGADQDILEGQDGDDELLGGAEADTLSGGAGADRLDGGAGYDTATYRSAAIGVLVNLAVPGSGGGDAQGDSYVSIERIVGSSRADILLGSAASDNFGGGESDDVIDGKAGDDLLSGDAGADRLNGGAGSDFAAYTLADAAVTVSLATGQGSGGDAQGDVLSNIENLQGSDFADVLEGSAVANWLRGLNGENALRGLGGDDLLEGGKDADLLDGGDGVDILRASVDFDATDPMLAGGLDTLRGGAGDDALYGDAGGDLMEGGDGADQIFGGRDADVIRGDAGDDAVRGGAGGDLIDAGEGVNVAYGDDGADTLTAGSGNDQLSGGNGDDIVTDLAGNNQLNGDADNDTLKAGLGNDQLRGGSGNDRLEAGEGANLLQGDAGDDVLLAGAGADVIDGGADNDTAASGAGNDDVKGADGNDTLDAGIGSDRVDGGDGDDLLSVGNLRGALQDEERIDHLFGAAGFDTITADFSNQTAQVTVIAGTTQSLVFADGTEARDFENAHDLFTGSAADVLRLDGTSDDGFGNLLKTGAGDDVVFSGRGNDNVDAGAGNDLVNGGDTTVKFLYDGWGTVIGHEGDADVLAGGDGNDSVSFDQLRKTVIYQGSSSDLGKQFPLGVYVNLATSQTGRAAEGIIISGFENVIGTDGGDTLIGDDGDNVFQPLRGGGLTSGVTGGPDSIDGGGGNDTLRIDFSLSDLADAAGVRANGAWLSRQDLARTKGYDDYGYSNIEHLDVTGASKGDLMYSARAGFADRLVGLGGDDMLGGNGGADTLLGGDGNDRLSAQGQFDLGYNGTADGHDVIDGGSGDDVIEDIAFAFGGPVLGASALFQLDGGAGRDTLSVDFSNQSAAIVWDSAAPASLEFADGAYARNFEVLRHLATGAGNDVITQQGRVDNSFYLGAGDDTLKPGLGLDTVDAGAGTDTVILDYSIGDTADMAGVQGGGNADGGTYFRPLAADPFNRPDSVYLRNVERVQITGTSKSDSIAGTYGDDVLIGGGGNDVLDGFWGGNNLLDGGDGDDVLKGSYGINGSGANDTLLGGAGNDVLQPRTGSDTASGGAGNDSIMVTEFPAGGYGVDVFDGGDGDDVIADVYFNSGATYATAASRLQLDGGDGFDTLSADFGNQTAAIDFVGGRSNSVDFGNGNFFRNFESFAQFMSGAGDDRFLIGGRSDQSLAAGGGNDTIDVGVGQDHVLGGAGDDLLVIDYRTGDDARVGGVEFYAGQYLQRSNLDTGALVDRLFVSGVERFKQIGASKADTLVGGDFADTLDGQGGDDTLTGGSGADLLTGGAGADRFAGLAFAMQGDTITDFGLDDRLDIASATFTRLRYDALTGHLDLDPLNNGRFDVRLNLAPGLVGEFVATVNPAGQPAGTQVRLMKDSDADGVGDFRDNAILIANPDQRDTDGDGYGNVADADYNQDKTVDLIDLSILGSRFGSSDANADMNGDGTVDMADLAMLESLYGKAPGPSYIDDVPAAGLSATVTHDGFDFGPLRQAASTQPAGDAPVDIDAALRSFGATLQTASTDIAAADAWQPGFDSGGDMQELLLVGVNPAVYGALHGAMHA